MQGKKKQNNNSAGREEIYQLYGGRYVKVYDSINKKYSFFRNDNRIGIKEWNEAVNRHYPMAKKAFHPFFLIRYLEKRRRRIILNLVTAENVHFGSDIGCESGHLTSHLAAKGIRMLAVDLDRHAVAEARKNISPELPVRYLCGDVMALPLKSGLVDFSLCSETLEHVDNIGKALKELARVTRPGGKLVLSVPNDRLLISLKRILGFIGLRRILGGLSSGQPMGHLMTLRKRDLRSFLPENTTIIQSFYDKPFFLNLYVVAEVTG